MHSRNSSTSGNRNNHSWHTSQHHISRNDFAKRILLDPSGSGTKLSQVLADKSTIVCYSISIKYLTSSSLQQHIDRCKAKTILIE